MAKTLKSNTDDGLVPTVADVPRISDAERDALRTSLDQAREDIAAGRYDVLTPETLETEFAGIFNDDRTDEELEQPSGVGPSVLIGADDVCWETNESPDE